MGWLKVRHGRGRLRLPAKRERKDHMMDGTSGRGGWVLPVLMGIHGGGDGK